MRTFSEAPITTKSARAKLPEGIHWRLVDTELHLGYRRGKRPGGRWVARWYVGDRRYKEEVIGTADDAQPADGVDILHFDQARAKAVRIATERRAEARAEAEGPAPTVHSAIDAYVALREARDPEAGRDSRTRLTRHVLSSTLADRKLSMLAEHHLTEWLDGLPAHLAPATVRRLVNDLKAALNAAGSANRKKLPAEFPAVVKHGLAMRQARSPVAREKQILSDADIRRMLYGIRRSCGNSVPACRCVWSPASTIRPSR